MELTDNITRKFHTKLKTKVKFIVYIKVFGVLIYCHKTTKVEKFAEVKSTRSLARLLDFMRTIYSHLIYVHRNVLIVRTGTTDFTIYIPSDIYWFVFVCCSNKH